MIKKLNPKIMKRKYHAYDYKLSSVMLYEYFLAAFSCFADIRLNKSHINIKIPHHRNSINTQNNRNLHIRLNFSLSSTLCSLFVIRK